MFGYEHNVFWNNFRSTRGRVSAKIGFLENLINKSFLKKLTNPYIIWTGNGSIPKLEKMILNSKIRNKLGDSEFYFYLYEPLCFRIGEFNRSFYSDFDSTEDLSQIIVDEFESIKIFVKNNNITNFRIFTTDYRMELLKSAYPDLKVNCLDIFLREYVTNFIKERTKEKITKKFWCGNWRYTVHRHLVISYLSTITPGTYSWHFNCPLSELKNNNWFKFDSLEKENNKQFLQLIEGVNYLETNDLIIDQHIESTDISSISDVFIPEKNTQMAGSAIFDSYNECFCAVVNETRFAQPFANVSEKTLAAIGCSSPFILVAPPYSIEYIKKLGFKTFDRWWDESYDTEENHYKRMIKIFNLIDYINSKSFDELEQIYAEMNEVLEHNKKILKTLAFNDIPL